MAATSPSSSSSSPSPLPSLSSSLSSPSLSSSSSSPSLSSPKPPALSASPASPGSMFSLPGETRHDAAADSAGPLTFHRFGDLPYEIRHMIWRLALCNSRGIHFMKLSILSPEQHEKNLRAIRSAASSSASASADEQQSQPQLHQQIPDPTLYSLYQMWPFVWQHFRSHVSAPIHNVAPIPPWNNGPVRDISRHGMHEVARARAARTAREDERHVLESEPPRTSTIAPGSLTPILPTTLADDISYFVNLDMEAAKLSATCPDAHEAVQRVMRLRNSRDDSLRLGRGGDGSDVTRSWVTAHENSGGHDPKVLSGSLVLPMDDVVYLEYAEDPLYATQWRIRMDIDCANLARIKHVAVRYDASWNRQRAKCIFCKYAHWFSEAYPTHLYQFLSRYLPNLETFYFLDDSLKRRRTASEPNAEAIWLQPHFLSKGHTYWVANAEQWTLSTDPENSSSRVLNALDWLRTSFREYASKSRYNRHGNPHKVKFRVLAKENTAPRFASQRPSLRIPASQTRAQPVAPGQVVFSFAVPKISLSRPFKMVAHEMKRLQSGTLVWRMRKKRRHALSQQWRQGRKRPDCQQKEQPVWESKLPVRFGEGGGCKAQFTFRCERARIGKEIGWKVRFDSN